MSNFIPRKRRVEAYNPLFGSGTWKATLVDSAEWTAVENDADKFSEIPSTARLATVTLANVSFSNTGKFMCDNFTWASVPVGDGSTGEYTVFWKDTGTESTSPIGPVFDTATGLPVTPNGASITFNVNAAGLLTV